MRSILLVAILMLTANLRAAEPSDRFAMENRLAWCIVPFDGKNRSPAERAVMLQRLGFRHYAYDWREQHLPTFVTELAELKRHGITLDAVWFPASLDKNALFLLEKLAEHQVKTQLWVSMNGGSLNPTPEEQRRRVELHARALRPIVDAAAKIGCTVGLYNHGGWFGEPENQLAILAELKAKNVGLVYNQHHGHHQVERFAEFLPKIVPHLYALNLNGMTKNGDTVGKKILPLGQGELDLGLLRTIHASGYRGPIGILGHTNDDAEERLRDNLDGLNWLMPQLTGTTAGPRPIPRTVK